MHSLALRISGTVLWAQYVLYESFPFLFAVWLGISLSLSLAGLLLPSTLTPISEFSRALDIAFNDTIQLYASDLEWCRMRPVLSAPSWEEWMWSWIAFHQRYHDCEPLLACHADFLLLFPPLRPSTLALQVPDMIRVISFRLRVEQLVWNGFSAFSELSSALYAKAVIFASEHPGLVFMLYSFFPSRLVVAMLKHIISRPRTRSSANT